MLTTVEAEVDVSGNVRLLEPLEVTKTTRAIVTLLEETNGKATESNGSRALEFLRDNRLPEEARPTVEEIEEQIREARESWD